MNLQQHKPGNLSTAQASSIRNRHLSQCASVHGDAVFVAFSKGDVLLVEFTPANIHSLEQLEALVATLGELTENLAADGA